MNAPLTFLLGAGASLPFGIPVMTGFYNEFREHVRDRHPHCFSLLETFENTSRHDRPDLETLLTDLGHVTGLELGFQALNSDSSAVGTEIERARELRGYLDAFIVDTCERYEREKAVTELSPLLALSEIAPIWFFSTNFDRIVEHCCEHKGIAWSDGFTVGDNHPVADWTGVFDTPVRLVKLHGSVNWYEDDPGKGLHRLDRGYALPAHDFRLVRGGQELKPLMIIPTLEKEALGTPYVQLSLVFTDVLSDARLLVIAGNSLRDKHIRAYVESRIDNLLVLLISPSADRSRGILGRPDRTFALSTGFSEFLILAASDFKELAQHAVSGISIDELKIRLEEFVANAGAQVKTADLRKTDPDLFGVFEELRIGNVTTRIHSLRRLSEFSHPAVVGRVIDALENDDDAPVRAAAVEVLVGISGLEAVPILKDRLAQEQSSDVLIETVLALHSLGTEGDAVLKVRIGREFSPEVRTIIHDVVPPTDVGT